MDVHLIKNKLKYIEEQSCTSKLLRRILPFTIFVIFDLVVEKMSGFDHDDKSNFMYDEAISFDYRE